jgi:hypothetical protein
MDNHTFFNSTPILPDNPIYQRTQTDVAYYITVTLGGFIIGVPLIYVLITLCQIFWNTCCRSTLKKNDNCEQDIEMEITNLTDISPQNTDLHANANAFYQPPGKWEVDYSPAKHPYISGDAVDGYKLNFNLKWPYAFE